MKAHLFDSSGIVKNYVNEVGSAWVAGIVDPAAGNRIHLASLTGVEVVSAIVRRQRGGSISATDAAVMLADFRHDFATVYDVVAISAALIAHAMFPAEAHALRGSDAVQLAVALEVNARCLVQGSPFTLVSADAALNAAALAEGLTVEDPNKRP